MCPTTGVVRCVMRLSEFQFGDVVIVNTTTKKNKWYNISHCLHHCGIFVREKHDRLLHIINLNERFHHVTNPMPEQWICFRKLG